MGRRVFTVKVVKQGQDVYVRLLGRNDRGQNSLIAHGSAVAQGKGKNTAIKLVEETFASVKKA